MTIFVDRKEMICGESWFSDHSYMWARCQVCNCRRLVKTYIFGTSFNERAGHCYKCGGCCFCEDYKREVLFREKFKGVVLCS